MKESEIMPKDMVTSMGNRNVAMRSSSGSRGGGNNIGIRRGFPAFKQSNTVSNRAMERSTVRADRGGGREEEKKKTKLYISNLDKNVSVGDIRELFMQFGNLKRSKLHHDENGRSQGTAEVEYGSRGAALRAMESYNGVPLDGKAMNIEIVGTDIAADEGRVSVFQRLGGLVQNDRNRNRLYPGP